MLSIEKKISTAQIVKYSIIGVVLLLIIIFASKFYITVEPGHVGVAALFGDVQPKHYPEGFHFVNPLLKWVYFDTREKTHLEKAKVPSQDQLQTDVDVSVQFNLIKSAAPRILQTTGTFADAKEVHIIPKFRSLLREQGKTIKRAEDFFLEETQARLEGQLLAKLSEYLQPKGIEVTAVLIREINLPEFIKKAIEKKKEREQEVEKQKAELERFRTEQQQKIAFAEAEKNAAKQESVKIKMLADAKAYEIKKINEAIADNPSYIKLQALEALKAISKDGTSKIYFINGDSPTPLPLMHIGDNPVKTKGNQVSPN